MSGFFNIIGVPPTSSDAITDAFDSIQSADGDEIALFKCRGGSTVAFTDTILTDSEGIAQALSADLSWPVILLFYAEDVVWGYNLFKGGEEIDRYSSRPNYWKLQSPEDYARQTGSASAVAADWPDVKPDSIAAYLTDKEKISEEQKSEKAYPDDEHEIWDGWQLTDFMRKLGLSYPFDDDGALVAEHLASISIGTKKGLAQKAEQDARSKAFDEAQAYCQEHDKPLAEVWGYYQEHGILPTCEQDAGGKG